MVSKEPFFLGVTHSFFHEDHDWTLDWIRENVKPGMKVGIEVEENFLKDVLSRKKRDLPHDARFWVEIHNLLKKKKAVPVPIQRRETFLARDNLAMDIGLGVASREDEDLAMHLSVSDSAHMLRVTRESLDGSIFGAGHGVEMEHFAPRPPRVIYSKQTGAEIELHHKLYDMAFSQEEIEKFRRLFTGAEN